MYLGFVKIALLLGTRILDYKYSVDITAPRFGTNYLLVEQFPNILSAPCDNRQILYVRVERLLGRHGKTLWQSFVATTLSAREKTVVAQR